MPTEGNHEQSEHGVAAHPLEPREECVDLPPPSALAAIRRRIVLYSVGFSLLAAVLAWSAADRIAHTLRWHPQFRIPNDPDQGMTGALNLRRLNRARVLAESKNTALAMGILGAAVGASFGVAGGVARRSQAAALRAAAVGLLLGASVEVAAAFTLVPWFFQGIRDSPTPFLPLMVHTAMYAAVGAVGGLAFALGFRGWGAGLTGCLAGLLGAVLGSIGFCLLQAVAFPLEPDFSPIPGRAFSRLVAHLCVALAAMLSAVVVLAGREPPKRNAG